MQEQSQTTHTKHASADLQAKDHRQKTARKAATGQAFGLLGTLSGGDVIITEEGKEVPVFSMAERTEALA